MKREEALAKFCEEEQNYIDGIKAGFLVKIQENANDIADCLQKVFSDIRTAVEEKGKKDIMFIHFSILRIDFLNHIYRFLAQVMDARWYMDTAPVEVTFLLGDCFSAFTEARKKLELDSKKYMGKVNRYDIDNLLMEAGMECNIMLANLLRFVFRDIEKNQDFESLPSTSSRATSAAAKRTTGGQRNTSPISARRSSTSVPTSWQETRHGYHLISVKPRSPTATIR